MQELFGRIGGIDAILGCPLYEDIPKRIGDFLGEQIFFQENKKILFLLKQEKTVYSVALAIRSSYNQFQKKLLDTEMFNLIVEDSPNGCAILVDLLYAGGYEQQLYDHVIIEQSTPEDMQILMELYQSHHWSGEPLPQTWILTYDTVDSVWYPENYGGFSNNINKYRISATNPPKKTNWGVNEERMTNAFFINF